MKNQHSAKRLNHPFKRSAMAAVIAGLCATPVWATPGTPLGAPVHVNALGTRGEQPSVARGANGTFLVIWNDFTDACFGVCAQLFNANGTPKGPAFLAGANESSIDDLSVSSDHAGNFVVAWVTSPFRPSGLLTSDLTYVRAQRISADGSLLGAPIQVTKETFPDLLGVVRVQKVHNVRASVAVDADGDFVVAWRTAADSTERFGTYYHQFALSSAQAAIHARRYNAAGVAQGSAITVEAKAQLVELNSGDYTITEPALAIDDDGDFVVSWWSASPTTQIQARRYDASGKAQGSRLAVASGSVGFPAVGMDAVGNFVVSWNQSGSGDNIVAQRFNTAGVAQGSLLTVQNYPSPYQQPTTPVLSMAADGSFVIAWSTLISSATVSIYPPFVGIYARPFTAAGSPRSPTFAVHVDGATGEGQSEPSIAFDSAGNIIGAWNETSAYYSDDVYVQRFSGN